MVAPGPAAMASRTPAPLESQKRSGARVGSEEDQNPQSEAATQEAGAQVAARLSRKSRSHESHVTGAGQGHAGLF